MKYWKLLSVCSIFLTMLLSGCDTKYSQSQSVPTQAQTTDDATGKPTVPDDQTNPKSQPTSTLATQTDSPSTSPTQTSGSPLDKACSQMESDFASSMAKITQGDTDKLNFVIASDRLNGLQAFDCHGQNFSDIIGKDRDLMRQNLKDSLVYSGYTTDGLHFIALVQSTRTADQIYKPIMATLRNDEQEYQLLYDLIFKLGYRNMDGGYFAIDLYAEDLSGKREKIPVDSITVSTMKAAKWTDAFPITPENKELTQLLKQYKRGLGDPHDIRNKSWNLFLFASGTISDDHPLIIDVPGRRIYMTNTWL